MRLSRSSSTLAQMFSPPLPPGCVGYASIAGRISVGCPSLPLPLARPTERLSSSTRPTNQTVLVVPATTGVRGEAQGQEACPASRDGVTKKKRPSFTRALWNWSITNQRGRDVERTTLLPESSSERERKSKTEGASAGQVSITSWPLASLLTASKIFDEFNARWY